MYVHTYVRTHVRTYVLCENRSSIQSLALMCSATTHMVIQKDQVGFIISRYVFKYLNVIGKPGTQKLSRQVSKKKK